MLALEEAFISLYRISRAIIFRFNSKTQVADVSVTLRPPYLCPSEGHKHGVSIQNSINLGDTLLKITSKWKTAKTWFLAMLIIHQSSIVSQILDFIHWMVTIFSFDHKTGENREFTLSTQLKKPSYLVTKVTTWNSPVCSSKSGLVSKSCKTTNNVPVFPVYVCPCSTYAKPCHKLHEIGTKKFSHNIQLLSLTVWHWSHGNG